MHAFNMFTRNLLSVLVHSGCECLYLIKETLKITKSKRAFYPVATKGFYNFKIKHTGCAYARVCLMMNHHSTEVL